MKLLIETYPIRLARIVCMSVLIASAIAICVGAVASTKYRRMRVIFLLSMSVLLLSSECSKKKVEPRESTIPRYTDVQARGTPIPLQLTKENQGKRCEPRAYTDGGGDDNDNPTCYKLQVRLVEAVIAHNLSAIKDALRDGANPKATFNDNYTALHTAAVYGQADAALLLLDNGADVNEGNFISGTPLMAAADNGRIEVVRILLERGANVCVVADGGTALDGARKAGHGDIVELLRAAGAEKCK